MEVLSHLQHLWPDFSAFVNGEASGLVVIFWAALLLIFSFSLIQLYRHNRNFKKRLKTLTGLIKGQDKSSLALKRRETEQAALNQDPKVVGPLWREFDETLVLSNDNQKLFNTLDADHFFNARTLAMGLTGSRLLAAAPSFLVAIGVLGTFVGLTVGLDNLNLDSRSDVDTLRDGIDGLIQGAAVAFMTSVWGVGLSVLLNLIEKVAESRVLVKIAQIQHKIDFLYPRIPAEQSLVNIADHTLQSKEALQELHERIGDRMQETMEGMSEAMQSALADTLNSIMKPAIDRMVDGASQQSTDVLERLVDQFMEGMNSAGRNQSELMQQAAEGMHEAVGSMSNQFTGLVEQMNQQKQHQEEVSARQARAVENQIERLDQASDTKQQALQDEFGRLLGQFTEQATAQSNHAEQRESERREAFSRQVSELASQQQSLLDAIAQSVHKANEQSLQMAEQHRELMNGLERTTESVTSSSKYMDSTANQLGFLSGNIKEASDVLGSKMSDVTGQLEEAGRQNTELAGQLREQSQTLEGLQAAIRESIEQYGLAAKLSNEGMDTLRTHQEEWLSSIRTEFDRLTSSLRVQVTGIEEQASQWLQAYSSQVVEQVDDRMNVWNKHSQEYANSMLHAVQNMNRVLDELESR
jgi:hypothetical protein